MSKREGIPLGTVHRLMKLYTSKRISMDAVEFMKMKLEEFLEETTKKAEEAASHARRNTIRPEDIKMALKA